MLAIPALRGQGMFADAEAYETSGDTQNRPSVDT